MNQPTIHHSSFTIPERLEDCTPAQLAWLLFNGTYGQRLMAERLLEAIAQDRPEPAHVFPKGRWT